MKKYILLGIICLTIFIAPKTLAADNPSGLKLSVSPALLPITLTPGKTQGYTLTVRNLSDISVPLKLSVESFEASDEEGGYKFDNITSPLVSWISLDKTDMIVDAGDKRDVNVTISVPHEVEVGGYYAVIFLTPYSPLNPDKPVVTPRIGVPVFASLGIDESLNQGSIETFSVLPMFSNRGPINYTLRTKNNGLSHFNAKPVFIIKQLINGKQSRIDLPEKIILPGKIRRWDGNILNDAGPNIYSIEANVSIGAGNIITQNTMIIILPWLQIIIGFVAFIVILLSIKHRKKVTKAIKVFLGG